MKTLILACETLRDELEAVQNAAGTAIPVLYLADSNHDHPRKLHDCIQAALDGLNDVQRVILCFGFCGNAVAGLHTGDFTLILPRAEDCISLVLGSPRRRQSIGTGGTLFLTAGWARNRNNLMHQIRDVKTRYGDAKADRIIRAMLAPMHRLCVIETGAYDVSSLDPYADAFASEYGLCRDTAQGDLSFLTALITGPWTPERFLILPPHSTLASEHLTV